MADAHQAKRKEAAAALKRKRESAFSEKEQHARLKELGTYQLADHGFVFHLHLSSWYLMTRL